MKKTQTWKIHPDLTLEVQGYTYPFRKLFKQAGFRWDPEKKAWVARKAGDIAFIKTFMARLSRARIARVEVELHNAGVVGYGWIGRGIDDFQFPLTKAAWEREYGHMRAALEQKAKEAQQ